MRKMSLILAIALLPPTASAQVASDTAAVLAVVDSAMVRISRNDFAALADLMIAEGMTYRVGSAGDPARYRADSREATAKAVPQQRLTERGFSPEVRIAGRLATVWLPYDFYIDGKWSHCGVDTFTMLKVGEQWQIAVLAWTVEQPPACKPHPAGPPQ